MNSSIIFAGLIWVVYEFNKLYEKYAKSEDPEVRELAISELTFLFNGIVAYYIILLPILLCYTIQFFLAMYCAFVGYTKRIVEEMGRLNFAITCSYVLIGLIYNSLLIFLDLPTDEKELEEDQKEAKLIYFTNAVIIIMPVLVLTTLTLHNFLKLMDSDDFEYFIGRNKRASSI